MEVKILTYGGWLLFLVLGPIVIETWKKDGTEKALKIIEGTIFAVWAMLLVGWGKHLIWWLSE